MKTQNVAIVTGAARGIGFACAKQLVNEGMKVYMLDIEDEIITAAANLGEDAVAVCCDVADASGLQQFFLDRSKELSRLTVLVNCAGIAINKDFFESSVEDFNKVISVNLTAAFVATQCAAKIMVENQIAGSIINMSSINAEVAIPTMAGYCASKGGLRQLTKVSALALAPHNIRVNAVGPGSIDTNMLLGLWTDSKAVERIMSRTPLKRVGSPEEIASIVTFLASDKASYITGETIHADGGRIAMNYTC